MEKIVKMESGRVYIPTLYWDYLAVKSGENVSVLDTKDDSGQRVLQISRAMVLRKPPMEEH